MVSRATSPQPDPEKQKRTRVARSTEPVDVSRGARRSRPPRLVESACQTEVTTEFGPLTLTLRKVMPSESFDYFDKVKKSLQELPKKVYVNDNNGHGAEEGDEEGSEEDDAFMFKRAAMTQLLPGTTPLTKKPSACDGGSAAKIQSYQKKLEEEAAALAKAAAEGEDSEYEYETDEEDDESSRREEEESYEQKAENILENDEEDNSDLDYIDDDSDELGVQNVQRKKRRRKKAFISGTIDIDDLLGKEDVTPNNLVAFGEPVNEEEPRNDRQCNGAARKDLPGEETPWWIKSKYPLQYSASGKSLSKKTATPPVINGEEDEAVAADDVDVPDRDDTVAEEDAWEEEELEGEGEWEYYDEEEVEEEEEGEEEEEEVEESLASVPAPEEKDDRTPWIVQGLSNLIPKIPLRHRNNHLDDVADEEEEQTEEKSGVSEKANEVGYKEWLEESATILHDQTVEDLLNETNEEAADAPKEDASSEQSELAVKAQRLVGKLSNSEGPELKRILFSLKAIFQSDRGLVYEFVQANGISKLVELQNNSSEPHQFQNLVLRALGQIMLYVDGMNGIMANPGAVQLLYRLVATKDNILVSKTAIKLLLVFVEYTESNSLTLVQAVNFTDKELGVIPWTNVMEVLSKDHADEELACFALTLVNKTLFGVPDQDTFYDNTDYLEELSMETVCCRLSSTGKESLIQQVQLYNVALKQEDGEPVTEEEISHLDEDATEMGLRTTLRKKSSGINGVSRKSLRHKTKKIADAEADSTGDIVGVSMHDLERILGCHGLPTTSSGDRLNEMTLSGFLDKARAAFVAKLAKGELPGSSDSKNNDAEEEQKDAQGSETQREGELRWQKILETFSRPLVICDMDFSDLQDEHEEEEVKAPPANIPAPPPPPPPPPFDPASAPVPPPPPPLVPLSMPPPPPIGDDGRHQLTPKKHKKTLKLFWKEIRDCPMIKTKTVWDELESAEVDTAMLEYLFENRGKESAAKDASKGLIAINREIIVLDHKRSNAINIGMTKLPPPRIIKSAVLKMDASIMSELNCISFVHIAECLHISFLSLSDRESVEKLLTMLPSEEEISRIQDAQEAQPDLPLGTAEQFLLTLASVSGIEARLRLWAFKMDFEITEKEVCDPLMDLKTGLELLRANATFRAVLATLRAVGNFLNGTPNCRGFHLDYLSKVPEVKDTVHKHSLLYHMTYWVLEGKPDSSDLYSEFGPLTRASRTHFGEVARTLTRLESECKLAWDYLKTLREAETESNQPAPVSGSGGGLESGHLRNKMMDFLEDAAQRILVMQAVHRSVMRRYEDFLTWLGLPPSSGNGGRTTEYPPHSTCRTLSEFALEYRTTRDRVILTIEKKKAAREKKRQAKAAAAEREALAAARAALKATSAAAPTSKKHRREPVSEDAQLRALLDMNATDNGTLRRRKKHHHSTRNMESSSSEALKAAEEKRERREQKRSSKKKRHSSVVNTNDLHNLMAGGGDIERGLLETLMGVGDQNDGQSSACQAAPLRRRSSVKRRSVHEIKRSRTRENNVYEELLAAAMEAEEEQGDM